MSATREKWRRSEIIEWKLGDDEGLRAYDILRRPLYRDFVVGLVVSAPLFVVVYLIYGYGSLWFPILSLIALGLLPAYRLYMRKEHGITGVELHLNNGSFEFHERYGPWTFPHRIASIGARWIRSARWGAAGLELFVRPSFGGRIVISYRLIGAGDGVRLLQEWCEAHKIVIDGVPPLPGGYVRPIEERRGL